MSIDFLLLPFAPCLLPDLNKQFKSVAAYLYYVLKGCVKDIENLASGMTYKEINSNNIKNYKILMPPLTVQEQLVSEIEQIESQISAAQKVISEAGENKLNADILLIS